MLSACQMQDSGKQASAGAASQKAQARVSSLACAHPSWPFTAAHDSCCSCLVTHVLRRSTWRLAHCSHALRPLQSCMEAGPLQSCMEATAVMHRGHCSHAWRLAHCSHTWRPLQSCLEAGPLQSCMEATAVMHGGWPTAVMHGGHCSHALSLLQSCMEAGPLQSCIEGPKRRGRHDRSDRHTAAAEALPAFLHALNSRAHRAS